MNDGFSPEVILAKVKASPRVAKRPSYYDDVKDVAVAIPEIVGQERMRQPRSFLLVLEIMADVARYGNQLHPVSTFWEQALDYFEVMLKVWSEEDIEEINTARAQIQALVDENHLKTGVVTVSDVFAEDPTALLPDDSLDAIFKAISDSH